MKLPEIVRISLVALLMAACSLAPAAQPTPSAAPLVTAIPTATVATTIEPTLRPPPATDTLPPRGFLRGEDDPVEGWLGSYCWHGTCADAPGVPEIDDLPYVYTSDSEMEFSLSDGATFARWHATYWSGDGDEPITLGQDGEDFDPDARPSPGIEPLAAARFASPPGGDSVVVVQVFFDGGDLSYAWHVAVPRRPPTAELRLPNGTSVEGQLGSWCYDGGCADSPAFPKSLLPALDIRASAELRFTFAEGDQFAFARALYAPDSETYPFRDLASGGTYVDPDTNATPGPLLTSFTFDAPSKGDWVLKVNIRFPGQLGDAPYYWHAMVE